MLESGLRDILVVDGEESVYHKYDLDTIVALSFPLVEEKSGNVDSRGHSAAKVRNRGGATGSP
jgi:hypothetical protein